MLNEHHRRAIVVEMAQIEKFHFHNDWMKRKSVMILFLQRCSFLSPLTPLNSFFVRLHSSGFAHIRLHSRELERGERDEILLPAFNCVITEIDFFC